MNVPVSGQQLVADYQSVLLSMATIEYAKNEAERSELEVLRHLSDTTSGMYLNPSSFSEETGEQAARASLDAHIKKVQAEQLQSMSTQQIQAMIYEDKQLYAGKKVRIHVQDTGFQPIDALWFDQRNGYRTNPLKSTSIDGTIAEVVLEKNALVIKPGRLRRLVNSNLQNYIVYVINPNTLEPAVEITVV